MCNYLQSAFRCSINFGHQIFKLCDVVELHWSQWQFSPAEVLCSMYNFDFIEGKIYSITSFFLASSFSSALPP